MLNNWKTTISGWLTLIAVAIHSEPSLVAFLPGQWRDTVAGIAGIVAAVSGATFAVVAKDSDHKLPLILFCGLAISGCAWAERNHEKIERTLQFAAGKAISAAQGVLINAASDELTGHADWLDSVAHGIRSQATTISARDVADVVAIWAPNGGKWQKLGADLAAGTAHVLEAQGKTKAAVVAEGLAQGLNAAAAHAREAGK